MVAHDTGFELIDENAYMCYDLIRLCKILDNKTRTVIHGPAITHNIISLATDEDAVVFMCRDLHDILNSQVRVGWIGESMEREKYKPDPNKPVAQIKLEYWDNIKDSVKNAFDVEYESLSTHPLWVPKDLRSDFRMDQWKLKAKKQYIKIVSKKFN